MRERLCRVCGALLADGEPARCVRCRDALVWSGWCLFLGPLVGVVAGALVEAHGRAGQGFIRYDERAFLDLEFGFIAGLSAALAWWWVTRVRALAAPVLVVAFAFCLHLTVVGSLSVGQELILEQRLARPLSFTGGTLYQVRIHPRHLSLALVDGLIAAALYGGPALVGLGLITRPRAGGD